MLIKLLPALLLGAVTVCPGQVTVRTRAFSFGDPVLVVRGEFQGEDGTAWLNAGSAGTLTLTISNNGRATARGAVLTLAPGAALKDLQVTRIDTLGDIGPGETRTEKIAVSAPAIARSQQGPVALRVSADPGPVSAETTLVIAVREIPAPRLDVKLAGPVPGETSKIRVRVRNTGSSEARGVSATFLPAGPGTETAIAEMGKTVTLGLITQGSSKEIPLTLKGAGGAGGPVAFTVRLDEERAKFSVFETISLPGTGAALGSEEAGFAAFKRGDYNQAITLFEKVVAKGKGSKEVWFSLGLSYFKNRNRARCLSSMQKSSALGNQEAKRWIRENTVPVEIVSVTYKQADADPFQGYSPPFGLGVLPFTDSLQHDTPLTDKLYNALKAKNESLRIFPYSTIRSEQVSWGLTALSPANKQILSALEKELSMNFAVAGVARDSLGSAFNMQILRCKEGTPVLVREFRTSKTSTAIDDAVMLLLKGRVPVYTTTRVAEVRLP
jgi:hypothetical protein